MFTRAQLRKAARDALWRQGNLRWKLDAVQREIYDQIKQGDSSRFVLECARRLGKTYLFAALALEMCLQGPKRRVPYACSTLKALKEFLIPNLEKLQEDAPPDCKGRFNGADSHWVLPNGSHISAFGADDKATADRGRGPEAYAAMVDEAGFFPVGMLTYVLRSVIRPQLLTTGGRTLVASTPAEIPEHDFTEIAQRAEAMGHYARRTLYDNPRLTSGRIEAFIAEDARDDGMTVDEYKASDTFRREYLAERAVDKLLVVVPEWEEARKTQLVAIPRPEFFRGAAALDWGGHDPHAGVFGYHHHELDALVVERELFMKGGEATDQLVEAIKAVEGSLWGTDRYEGTLRCLQESPLQELVDGLPPWMLDALYQDAPEQPFSRWGDTNIQLIRDLHTLHGLSVIPTAKDQKALQANELRVLVRQKRLYLHPSCVNTDRHLRTTTWENHKRKGFARRAGEHGDLLDACLYWARNVDRADPTPKELRLVAVNEDRERSKLVKAYMGPSHARRRRAS